MNGGIGGMNSGRETGGEPPPRPHFEVAIPIGPTPPRHHQLMQQQQQQHYHIHQQHQQLQPHQRQDQDYSPRQYQLPPHTPRLSHPSHSPAPPPSQHTQEHYLLLTALAESYFEAAHNIGAKAANARTHDVKAYYKLIATGLRCLESILLPQKGKIIQARLEAMVRLRYAFLLHEETDNTREAESILNKGIIMATRNNNLLDLSSSMQHLLARITFQMNPKAALIQLNSYIREAHERDNPLWEYAFRFLRCSLLSQSQDLTSAINALRKIRSIAEKRHDESIYILSSLIEAMIHLQNGPDGAENAEECLAKANSRQLSNIQPPPQLDFLRALVDLVGSLMLGAKNSDVDIKLRNLQNLLGQRERLLEWSLGGDFELPVNSSRPGKPIEKLEFRWMAREDIIVLGYFLSGMARFQSNTQELGKAELYLKEGLRRVDLNLEASGNIPYSVAAAQSRIIWRKVLRCYMQLYYSFLLAVRTDWVEAQKSMDLLHEYALEMPESHYPDSLKNLTLYLSGSVAHGTGDFPSALNYYNMLIPDAPHSELGIIATLNAVLILRGSEHRDLRTAEYLLSIISKHCLETKNTLLQSAYFCVLGTSSTAELTKTKKNLAIALNLATSLANQQITYITLAAMYARFFNGVVSEQAEKSARAAYVNAKKGRDNLWSLVSGNMLAECLARQGLGLEDGGVGLGHNFEAVVANLGGEEHREAGEGWDGVEGGGVGAGGVGQTGVGVGVGVGGVQLDEYGDEDAYGEDDDEGGV